VDAVVLIDANHGGRSVLKAISADLVFEPLMKTVYFPRISPLRETVMLRRLVADARTYSLRLGDLTGAKFHLDHVVRA
jgi:hypothetical protein